MPSAYVVQLHSDLYSKSASAYLARVKAKRLSDGEGFVPVILVAHQLAGSDIAEFDNLVKRMNVAAIVIGHYGCIDRNVQPLQKDHGHCDRASIIGDLRWKAPSEPAHPNVHGVTPAILNVNAMFHNIFWSVQLRPDTHQIAFRPFDAGNLHGFSSSLPVWSFADLMMLLSHWTPFSFNFPAGAFEVALAYACDYSAPDTNKDAQCTIGAF